MSGHFLAVKQKTSKDKNKDTLYGVLSHYSLSEKSVREDGGYNDGK